MNQIDWIALSKRNWKRKRGRNVNDEIQLCCVFGTPIHRLGTYYVRPAYTDGELWMCKKAYQKMLIESRR
jgi:hypothetical protein